MKLIDNVTQTLKYDLSKEIKKGSKVSIAVACFSIYAYRVKFDGNELIQKSIEYIDENLYVTNLQYTVTNSEQRTDLDADMIDKGDSFYNEKSSTRQLNHYDVSQIKYDLVGKIASATLLTRKTVVKILKGIRSDKFDMFKNNPEEFITKVIRLIKEQKANMIIDHISYNQLEGKYENGIFTAEKHTTMDRAFLTKKHIQD